MVYSKEQILEIIPQKDPFVFVDEITEIIEREDGEADILGKKVFSGKESFFAGHFPDQPVVPGVLLLEALAQTGAVYILAKDEYRGKTCFLSGMDNVKWKRAVLPGETILLQVTSGKIRHGIGKVHGDAYVEGELCCSADLITFFR